MGLRLAVHTTASQLTPQELIRTPLITELTPEETKLSIREIWPDAAIARELARGLTPERAEELRLHDVAEAEKQTPLGKRASEPMKHYL